MIPPSDQVMVYGFTSKSQVLERQLISKIRISQAFNPQEDPANRPIKNEYSAIWDTGATNTVITERVIIECGLKPTGMAMVETASGKLTTDTFLINAELPSGVGFSHLKVSKGTLKGVDVLIGMDAINTGDLAISNFQGKTAFAFRIPSIECIDFNPNPVKGNATVGGVNGKVGGNAKCPCGSGKKYKKCCGKP